ncbi:hypothetical protein VTK56DRAFT_6121 [Thermocarpiscus australiensis]
MKATSGDLPTSWGDEEYDENNTLHIFLRSIVERPDLASCVKVLQLIASPVTRIWTTDSGDVQSDPPDVVALLTRASVELGAVEGNIFHPLGRSLERDRLRSDLRPTYEPESDCWDIYEMHAELAALLCPNVSLIIHACFRDTLCWAILRATRPILRSLKAVALLGTISAHTEAHDSDVLLTAAPNLKTIHAINYAIPLDGYWAGFSSAWYATLPNLREEG